MPVLFEFESLAVLTLFENSLKDNGKASLKIYENPTVGKSKSLLIDDYDFWNPEGWHDLLRWFLVSAQGYIKGTEP